MQYFATLAGGTGVEDQVLEVSSSRGRAVLPLVPFTDHYQGVRSTHPGPSLQQA